MSQTLRRSADPKKNGLVLRFCYGDEENARIYAVHLTTANQSENRRAHLVSANKVLEQKRCNCKFLPGDLHMKERIESKHNNTL